MTAQAIAGELDYAQQELATASFTLYKQNEEKGDYTATMWFDTRASVLTDLKINFLPEDPVKRKLHQDLRYRQALSVAINREEINEAIYLGLATPRASTIRPDASYYEDWMGKHYAQYDPELANKLLDEMGLKWDKDKKYRLRSDGKTLSINLEYIQMEGPRARKLEMVAHYWEAVGVKANIKDVGKNYWPRVNANLTDFNIWHLGFSEEIGLYITSGGFDPYALAWRDWRNSDGEKGAEPPDYVQKYYRLADELKEVEFASAEYSRIAKELVTVHVENIMHIGVVGMTPIPAIIKNGIRNVPEDKLRGYVYRFWMVYYADQWFWKK